MTSSTLIEEVYDPRRWYSTNLVGVSTHWLASTHYNLAPAPLRVAATREAHPGLFELLRQSNDQSEAAEHFHHYMELAFGVGKRNRQSPEDRAQPWRSSYLKVLQGWGFDASSRPAAVLKGWVESRFGIVPTYHQGHLDEFPSEAWLRYLEEKLNSRFHNNCIQQQLDLLYEYTQFCLTRFRPLQAPRATLYRGVEQSAAEFISGGVRERRGVVRLNNCVSFATDRDAAEPFGDLILTVEVPLPKVLFYPGALNDCVINGETEVIALGGDYEVGIAYH